MSNTTTRWFVWVALVVLLPMPLYYNVLGAVPVWYALKVLFDFFSLEQPISVGVLFMLPQLLMSMLIFYYLSGRYIYYCRELPVNIRGSIMGLLILTALILFYTFPVYQSPFVTGEVPVTFLGLYR